MNTTTSANPLIVETPRGPSVAGTRITVYSLMDLIKADWSREQILQVMPLITAEQLDAVYEYIEQHREEVERDYARILRRSAELREHYEKVYRERSPFPPDMPPEEKRRLMVQKLEAMEQASQTPARNGNHDSR
jgi:uncharacterized protein (DUF433 family)